MSDDDLQIRQIHDNPDPEEVGVDAVEPLTRTPFFLYVSGTHARVKPDGSAEVTDAVSSFFAATEPAPAAATQPVPEPVSSMPNRPDDAPTPESAPTDVAHAVTPELEAVGARHASPLPPQALPIDLPRPAERAAPPIDVIEVIDLDLTAQIESLLYVAGEPVPVTTLAQALEVSTKQVEAALASMESQYSKRGVRLQRASNKIQLVSAPEMAARVQTFLGLEAINKLSPAALETLAIIAYKQPITKPQIEMIRGVNSDGVMNTLILRNLVTELGKADSVGHPMRYGVSFEFLQYFGLRGTTDLPHVEHIETLEVRDSVPAA